MSAKSPLLARDRDKSSKRELIKAGEAGKYISRPREYLGPGLRNLSTLEGMRALGKMREKWLLNRKEVKK